MANILWPSSAKTRARVPATVVLPEPPLPTIAIFIVGAFDALSRADRSYAWSDDAHRNSHGRGIVQPLIGNELVLARDHWRGDLNGKIAICVDRCLRGFHLHAFPNQYDGSRASFEAIAVTPHMNENWPSSTYCMSRSMPLLPSTQPLGSKHMK